MCVRVFCVTSMSMHVNILDICVSIMCQGALIGAIDTYVNALGIDVKAGRVHIHVSEFEDEC